MALILAVSSQLSFEGCHLCATIPLTTKEMRKARGFQIKIDTFTDNGNRSSTRPACCSTGPSNQTRRADDDAHLSTRIPSAGAISRIDKIMSHDRFQADASH